MTLFSIFSAMATEGQTNLQKDCQRRSARGSTLYLSVLIVSRQDMLLDTEVKCDQILQKIGRKTEEVLKTRSSAGLLLI